MGRIKQLMVKRASKDLLSKDFNFGEDFHENKKMLGRTMPSKKVRNKIAGYMARLKRAEKKAIEAPKIKEKIDVSADTSYS